MTKTLYEFSSAMCLLHFLSVASPIFHPNTVTYFVMQDRI